MKRQPISSTIGSIQIKIHEDTIAHIHIWMTKKGLTIPSAYKYTGQVQLRTFLIEWAMVQVAWKMIW